MAPSNNNLNINVKITEAVEKLKAETSKIKTKDESAVKNINKLLESLQNLAKIATTNSDLDKFLSKLNTLTKIVKSVEGSKTSKTLLDLINLKDTKEIEKSKRVSKINQLREEKATKKQIFAENFEKANLRYITGPNVGKRVSLEALTKNPEKAFSKMNPEDAKKAKELTEEYNKLKEEEVKLVESIKKISAEIDTLTQEISNLRGKIKEEKKVNPGSGSSIYENVSGIATDTRDIIENQQISNTKEKEKIADLSLDKIVKTQEQTSSLGKAFKQFSIYTLAVRAVKKAVREAISTIKELDSSLTEQAMVTGKTREQTYKLLSSYQNLAKQTGATTKEIADLATQFFRQGKSTNEALILTTAAMDAAKVAAISSSDSINYLTTALNGFQLSANDSMKVSDKFASVSANAATSYDEIATALSKVASQANLAGMSIDYTTALLAKGLETTREAPETMGTALKTVIARMREIGDYGETLDGDTDINNVESQLAYVGIALRDTNGELRSTEKVLDELGRKWDTLNSNQQAAVAKALAGTRQQSRLIAMMTDYERVIELQQISERSSGATLSQMGTYLEGMDAALNKVRVSYEKLITAFTNNEVIISIVNIIGDVLNGLASFMKTTAGSIAVFTVLGTLILSALGNKIKELTISKHINKEEIKKQKLLVSNNLENAKELKLQKQLTIEKAKQTMLETDDSDPEHAKAKKIIEETKAELAADNEKIRMYEYKLDLLKSEESLLYSVKSGLSGNLIVVRNIISGYKNVSRWLATIALKSKKNNIEQINDEKKKSEILGRNAGAKIIGDTGVAGIALAIAVMAALGIAVAGFAIYSNEQKKTSNYAVKSINDLANETYKLTEKSKGLETIINSYDRIDKAIIKTKADQEELNSLLEQAADKLSEEEQSAYKGLSDTQRINYLRKIQEASEKEADKNRKKTLDYINELTTSERIKFLSEDTSDANKVNAQQQLYAINNKTLYDYIDNELSTIKDFTSEEIAAIEKLTQSMLDGINPTKAYWYAQNPEKIKEIVRSISNLTINYEDLNKKVAEVLTSDDYNIYDKVRAYREAIDSLNKEQQELLKNIYLEIDTLNNIFKNDDNTLEYMVSTGISTQGINDINRALIDLGYETEVAINKIQKLFQAISSTNDIAKSIKTTFKDILLPLEETKEWNEFYTKILNAYSDAVSVGILNMGQNMQSIKKTIDNFYEKTSKWSTLSDIEKTEFLTDNAALFEGNDGLYSALLSGDYNTMYEALSQQDTLINRVAEQIKKIKMEIAIEESSLTPNKAYIEYLKEQLILLNNTNNLYRASLEFRLEQEKKYLNEYKNYLSDQKTALEDSLNERKDAYQKYFDSVNQENEDKEFEEKESTLIANITKLTTSTSANAINQRFKLEEELKNLEEERIQTLREKAQEAIISNIDEELQEINNKFDDLLNSQQALLVAMTGELNNPTDFLADLIVNRSKQEGLTALGLENYIKDLQTTYGSVVGNEMFKDIMVREIGNQLILNVAGKEINLSENDQQSIYEAIVTALKQVGLR